MLFGWKTTHLMCSSRVSYLEASDGHWPLIVDVNCDRSLQVLSNIPTLSRVTISYLATSKHSLEKHFKTIQVICSSSKFPSMFSIQWKFWPESVFTTMAAKWGFSNSRVPFSFTSQYSWYYKQEPSFSPHLFIGIDS